MEWNDSIENPEEETKRLEALIHKNPEDANAFYELGVLCEYMHDFPKAVQYCQKAIVLDQENVHFCAFLVYLYSKREYDEAKALEAAANLAELRPDEGDYYIERAMDSLAAVCNEPAYAYITKLRGQGRNLAATTLERWFYNP